MVSRNVAEDVDPPQVKREEIRPLNRDQTRALLKAAEGHRLEALYIVAVHTGMRPGELLASSGMMLTSTPGPCSSTGLCQTANSPRPRRLGAGGGSKLTTGSVRALRAHRKRQLEERM